MARNVILMTLYDKNCIICTPILLRPALQNYRKRISTLLPYSMKQGSLDYTLLNIMQNCLKAHELLNPQSSLRVTLWGPEEEAFVQCNSLLRESTDNSGFSGECQTVMYAGFLALAVQITASKRRIRSAHFLAGRLTLEVIIFVHNFFRQMSDRNAIPNILSNLHV